MKNHVAKSECRAGTTWARLRPWLSMTIALGLAAPALAQQSDASGQWWGQEERPEHFENAKFSNPTEITNPWFPIKPGLRLTFEGSSVTEEGTTVKRKMQINVTDLTKTVGGVRSVVSYDLDWAKGGLVEAELECLAQDDDGNVWTTGEYPEEYDNGDGRITGNPSWFHGLDDALAGILVPAKPAVGTPSFSEGWGPKVEYNDRGRVDSVGVMVCVPVSCYKDAVVIAESSADEVDAEQLKYYVSGVGNVGVRWRGPKDTEHQILWLTKIETLDAKGMDKVRASALALDKKARGRNKMYAQTAALEGPAKH
jgi:hypothetical protein